MCLTTPGALRAARLQRGIRDHERDGLLGGSGAGECGSYASMLHIHSWITGEGLEVDMVLDAPRLWAYATSQFVSLDIHTQL